MIKNNKCFHILLFIYGCVGISSNVYSMGVRSFVALPVEKGGAVARFSFEHTKKSDTLSSSMAYGISANQTLLLGLPYQLSLPAGKSPQGDLSVLYRHTTYQNDTKSGTQRFAVLGGVVVPTEKNRDLATQLGFVFTHLKDRNEIDIDSLYQWGAGNRPNKGRYDISWQYRLLPQERPDWGIAKELNVVTELNGRWTKGDNTTHQATLGLQQVHKKWVIEAAVSQALNKEKETSYLLSTRFHF